MCGRFTPAHVLGHIRRDRRSGLGANLLMGRRSEPRRLIRSDKPILALSVVIVKYLSIPGPFSEATLTII